MSVRHAFSWLFTRLKGGNYEAEPAGGLHAVKERDFSSDSGADHRRRLTITAGQTVDAWVFGTNTNSLSSCVIEIKGTSGQLLIAKLYDSVDSSGNATGAAETWNKEAMDWHMPHTISTRDGLSNADPAAHAGSPFSDVGQVAAKLQRVQLKNAGTSSVAVQVDVWN